MTVPSDYGRGRMRPLSDAEWRYRAWIEEYRTARRAGDRPPSPPPDVAAILAETRARHAEMPPGLSPRQQALWHRHRNVGEARLQARDNRPMGAREDLPPMLISDITIQVGPTTALLIVRDDERARAVTGMEPGYQELLPRREAFELIAHIEKLGIAALDVSVEFFSENPKNPSRKRPV